MALPANQIKARRMLVKQRASSKHQFENPSKRAQIRASTLMSRSPEYKANLVHKFWTDHEADFYNGNLYPLIDKTFLFTEISDAHHYMAQNQNCGKIILKNNF